MNQLQRVGSRHIFALVDLEPSITDSDDAKNLDEPITSISFDGVTFVYPGTSINVLNNVSFKVNLEDSWELWVTLEQGSRQF